MKELLNRKKIMILIVIIFLFFVILFLIYQHLNNDIYNTKYRVYQNGKWSNYSQNGMTVGDKKHPIQNIGFKYNNSKGYLYYNVFTEEWSEQQYSQMKNNQEKIFGLQINISNILHKKYLICYRTYNKKDKWLNWSCDGETNGNYKESITSIEVKIIPKDSNKKEYLKDYIEEIELNEDLQGGQVEDEKKTY